MRRRRAASWPMRLGPASWLMTATTTAGPAHHTRGKRWVRPALSLSGLHPLAQLAALVSHGSVVDLGGGGGEGGGGPGPSAAPGQQVAGEAGRVLLVLLQLLPLLRLLLQTQRLLVAAHASKSSRSRQASTTVDPVSEQRRVRGGCLCVCVCLLLLTCSTRLPPPPCAAGRGCRGTGTAARCPRSLP